ncbi:MAG: nucleotidyltransferase family protein [Magnetococcales bacterium]|nr:nucleotidyltransferase family protein [Magnetococcales bacterium]
MKAMILAAGLGKRLGAITQTIPKPLVPVRGIPVIVRTIQLLASQGLRQIIINASYRAEQLQQQIGDGQAWGVEVSWSLEQQPLETGGGVCQALPLLGDEPFLAINGDVLWQLDLAPLIRGYDGNRMDALLGLVAAPEAGSGDFLLLPDGQLQRGKGRPEAWTYSGIQILAPAPLRHYPVAPFSLNRYYDDSQQRHRLYGQLLTGQWIDIGTPERLAQAEQQWFV